MRRPDCIIYPDPNITYSQTVKKIEEHLIKNGWAWSDWGIDSSGLFLDVPLDTLTTLLDHMKKNFT